MEDIVVVGMILYPAMITYELHEWIVCLVHGHMSHDVLGWIFGSKKFPEKLNRPTGRPTDPDQAVKRSWIEIIFRTWNGESIWNGTENGERSAVNFFRFGFGTLELELKIEENNCMMNVRVLSRWSVMECLQQN